MPRLSSSQHHPPYTYIKHISGQSFVPSNVHNLGQYDAQWTSDIYDLRQTGLPRCRGLFHGITSPTVLCHKEPAAFPCMESNYPYAIKNQRGASKMPLNGGILKAPSIRGLWKRRADSLWHRNAGASNTLKLSFWN